MTTSSLPRLKIKTLKESGCLEPGFAGTLSWPGTGLSSSAIRFRSEEDRILLDDPSNSKPDHCGRQVLAIPLERLPCHFGGYRTWLRCPSCNGRTTSLFILARQFACRVCHGLKYESQQANKIDRLADRINRIFTRLGSQKTEIFSAIPKRPPRMHLKTYSRLRVEAEDAQDLLREAVPDDREP